jgi:hypothetical protein
VSAPNPMPRPAGAKFVEPRFKDAGAFTKPTKPKRLGRVKRLTPQEEAVRSAVFERDGGCLLHHHGNCAGVPLTPHHRRKASQGGKYTELNLMTLCSFHNDELEADADFALWALHHGVVLKRNDLAAFQLTGCPRSCSIDHRPDLRLLGENCPIDGAP